MNLNLRDIFEKSIDRPIDGVIKADDEESILNELEEYVITTEIEKNIGNFLHEYNNFTNKNGVWISGFFGSGKSHLLKILSLLLENKQIENNFPSKILSAKIKDDIFLRSEIEKAANIPSRSILFNIDQKASIISKQEIDALLTVFQSVLDQMCGYFSEGYIAKFERDLDKKGVLKDFKEEFTKYSSDGISWEEGRELLTFEIEAVTKAFAKATNQNESSCENIIDTYMNNYKVSIDDFAKQVKEFIDQQDDNFRLNFFVDEVGQFIADNSKLMVNLQTIAESLNTYCKGRAWIIVTAQEALDKVVGDVYSQQANDFSKIMARFDIRMPLTSQNVSEVIQKRLLSKNQKSLPFLEQIYSKESNNFGTLFNFSENSVNFKNYLNQDNFIQCYPFVPYQYDLFRESIKGLSDHNKFEGKHSSVGERSMLGVFRDVLISISDNQIGKLPSFDLMFRGIESALKSSVLTSISVAENNIGNDLAVRILKILFLVKYYRQFKPTLNNIRILLIDKFNINFFEFNKSITEALELLEKQTYIRRNNEEYEFLTDEEKDIEEEIKNTEIDSTDLQSELSRIIFQRLIINSKISHEESGNNFNFAKKIDGELQGQDHEISINVITPINELFEEDEALTLQSINTDELIIKLPDNNLLFQEILLFKKTEKFILQNQRSGLDSIKMGILEQKGIRNREMMSSIENGLQNLLSDAKLILRGEILEIKNNNSSLRLKEACKKLIEKVYFNISILRNHKYKDDDIKNFYLSAKNGLQPTEAQQIIYDYINAQKKNNLRITLKTIIDWFSKKNYGWSNLATLANVAGLIGNKKIELTYDSNLLIEDQFLNYFKNSNLRSNIIVQIKEDIPKEKTENLKIFFKKFFEKIPSSKEALDLAEEIKEELKNLNKKIDLYLEQINNFPFLENYRENFIIFKKISENKSSWIINDFVNEDELLQLKLNSIDPIIKFMEGSQSSIYKDAFIFYQNNIDNFTFLKNDKSKEIKKILNDSQCFLGNKIPILKKYKIELEIEISEKKIEESNIAIKKINDLFEKVKNLSQYFNSKEEIKLRIKQEIDENIQEFKNTNNIHSIQAILNNFSNNKLPILISALDENENQKVISSSSIKSNNKKLILESEEDVNEYIETYKEAILEEIKKGNKIKI